MDRRTLLFFAKVVFATLLIDAGLLLLFPLQLIIYIAAITLTISLLVFLYLLNKKVFLLAIFLLLFLLIYLIWQVDAGALLARFAESARSLAAK